MEFADLLRAVARRNRHRPLIFPLPRVVTLLARRLGRLGVISRTSFGERVNGLLNLHSMDTSASLAEIGLSLRPLAPVQTSQRRGSVRLATALLAYIGGTRPRIDLIGVGPVKRLVRLCEKGGAYGPVLPRGILRYPWLLRFIEPLPNTPSQLSTALVAATWVYDMIPRGANRFQLREKRSLIGAVLSLTGTILIETALFPLRLILAPLFSCQRGQSGRSGPHLP
jgi:hypothetical protein